MTKAEHVALLEQLAQYAPQRLKNRVALIVTEMLAPAPFSEPVLLNREQGTLPPNLPEKAFDLSDAARVYRAFATKRKAPKAS